MIELDKMYLYADNYDKSIYHLVIPKYGKFEDHENRYFLYYYEIKLTSSGSKERLEDFLEWFDKNEYISSDDPKFYGLLTEDQKKTYKKYRFDTELNEIIK